MIYIGGRVVEISRSAMIQQGILSNNKIKMVSFSAMSCLVVLLNRRFENIENPN